MSSDRSPSGPNPPPPSGDPGLPAMSTQALELQRSVSSAIIEAMGSMSSMISQTISQALSAHAPGPSNLMPAPTNPQPAIEPPAQENLIGVIQATQDSALRSRKRALPRQAERARTWKSARALTYDIDSDNESDMEAYAEADDHSDGELETEQEFPGTSGPRPSTSGSVGASTSAPNTASSLVDPSGNPLFDPDALHHPRSAEWMPVAHVSDYLEHWVRRPLSKEARSKLRAECPMPLIPNKVCETPAVDQKMTQFLAKTGWNPRKGLDSAIKSCQDKLLDIFGPLAKIFEMAESAKVDGSPVDPEELTGWIQRAICIAGSTNSSLSIERRKDILFKIDPKLANLALTETGKEAQGQLFGDSFIKDLSRYVGAFTALDKAQSSMKRVFQGRVSTRAGSGRGRLSGRSSYQARSSGRGSFNQRPPFQDQRNPPSFFPARGGQWRSRSVRGNPSYRKSFGKFFPSGDFFHPSRRGQTPSMFPRLVQNHIRPMGADHCAGVPHRTYGFPRFRPFSPAPGATGQGASGHRTFFPLAQGCDRKGPSYPMGRSQPHFSSSEKRGSIPSGHKSPGSELCGALPPLQDGGDSPPSGLADSRGLDGEAGSQRCLSDGSGGLLLQGPSSLPVEGRSVALPVMAWLRSRGVRLVIYLDDILIMHQDRQSLLQHLQWTSDLLTSLGFLLNLGKSCLTPSRRMEFLGFTVDSVAESLSLPAEKLRTIRKELRHALSTPSLSLRHLARIIGLLASSIQAVFPAPLHYRALQRLKIAHLRAGASFADAVILDQEAQEELRWWLSNLEAWNGRAIFGFQPEFTVESDASLQGWGAHCEGISTGGRWSESETRFHINALELLAGSFAIRSFTKGIAHACIRLRMDNVSAVRYVNHLVPVSSLVPDYPGTPGGCASPTPDADGSPPGPAGCPTSSPGRRLPSTSGVPNLRTPGEVEGVSEATRRLLDNAWAPGTRKSYRAAWRSWVGWCMERDLDPVSASVTHLLQFLTSLFEAGKAYRTINLFGSAISSTHQGFDGVPAGQHPLVSRLLRGSRLARPPRPRFTATWDVSLVLSFLSSWPDNASLSLRQLSAKLLTLFCLISCKRVSDVRALDHDARSFTPEGVTFNITRRTKTNIRSVSYPSFPSSPALCPVVCLREYELRTRSHRSADTPQLFLSIRHPFGPVTSPTLARWMKWVMSLSGIDTTIFTAHSARGAAATALAVSGARLEDILRLADWSRATTFTEFYFRPPTHVFSAIIEQL
ncbi:uncharacterized protein LOC122922247 [Bufo gargarizans]|uniref:uncharacterized protein LOC122922247 n=1 Tax=Bufo gargarizans TaxID=30331 RepID=UPI001CF2F3FE|nr:uncharacterized protein LOC122922247 [Bufo gargarizans]